jgi:cytochrome c oxidase subunit II
MTISRPAFVFALAIVAIFATLTGCASGPVTYEPGGEPAPGFFPPAPTTAQGQFVFDAYPIIFAIAVAVFLLVEGLLLWNVFRYRRKATDIELPTQTHGHNTLEIIWTLIPAAVVTGLFVFTVDTLGKVERNPESTVQPTVTVDVTGFQWQWTFDYNDQGLSFTGAGSDGPEMVLPVDETVRIRLHASDVIHSFYVPQFLYKKDVVPGRVNEFDVLVKDPGTYAGQCAEFCGLSHADMHFTVRAVTRAEFDQWVTEQQQARPTEAPPPPSGAPSVTITAVNITTFDPATLEAPADKPIVFDYHNADTIQMHNIAIQAANPDGTDWVGLPLADPGQSATYVSPPLKAGTYEFYCAVHPTTMRGTLNVH